MKLINTFFLLFITLHISHAVARSDKSHMSSNIEKACEHAARKDSCVSMLKSDPNSQNSDNKGLGLIALQIASSNASDISQHIKRLLDDPSQDPVVQDSLSECLDFFMDAAGQLEDAMAAMIASKIMDVLAWVRVAMTDAMSCMALFKGNESVLKGEPAAFHGLCDNALAILSTIK